MTAIAWIVRHAADTPETRPALYWTEAEANAHAAQYRPGVATVVPLGDVAAVRAQALEDAAAVCDSVDNHANPMTARDCADAIRALRATP